MKKIELVEVTLDAIVGGGQAIGALDGGRKIFVWGGLPGEKVRAQLTKKKSNFAEGIVTEVLEPSPERIEVRDPENYLSTSPWQIMTFEAEQRYKAQLIKEAFELHHLTLPEPIEVFTDGHEYNYRNKVEFSWYGSTDAISGVDTLDLAFFRRGSKGKIVVETSALLPPKMMQLALAIRDTLRTLQVSARQLKTLLIRCDQAGNCVWQLYIKDTPCEFVDALMQTDLPAQGGEIMYSTPKSPASVITERLASTGNIVLTDTILGVPFRYATEGFFQVNIPVYEQALRDMETWIDTAAASPPSFSSGALGAHYSSVLPRSAGKAEPSEKEMANQPLATSFPETSAAPLDTDAYSIDNGREAVSGEDGGEEATPKRGKVLDLYSGVGSIGLTIGGEGVTLVEINEHAVREMKRNIDELGVNATPVLAASEQALEYITGDKIVIVDPPRAGLHAAVIEKLLETKPPRIIYLSCNPATQARDISLLNGTYKLRAYKGYNFFPRTPHIEGLAVLDAA